MPIYRGCFDYTVVPAPRLYRFPDYFWQVRRLGQAVAGDVIFAIKATPQTVGVALREKRRRGATVVVCLDEWDGALMARRTPAERRAFWCRHWMHPLEENYYPLVERQLPKADLIISTSSFLQRKFGGVVVRMGADTNRFKPLSAEEKAAVRSELGLNESHRVIVFGGVVRPHKGVGQILEAMAQVNDSRLRLLIIGPITDTLSGLLKGEMGNCIVAPGAKPAGEMPKWLGAGDMAVLPMSNNLLAQSQVPCKVFEAMAMGLPVLAGAISDLPDIVAGSGETFAPGNTHELVGGMRSLLANQFRMDAYGREARRRCEEEFSFRAMEQKLNTVMDGLKPGRT